MDGAAEDLERLAQWALRAQEAAEAQRAALGRYALVWWTGEAADRYWRHVEQRRAALARCAQDLALVADSAGALAGAVHAETRLLRHLGVAA